MKHGPYCIPPEEVGDPGMCCCVDQDEDAKFEHIESAKRWCNPTLNYVDEATGVQHWIHHEPN